MKKLVFAMTVAVACAAIADMKVGTVDMLKLVRNHASYDQNKTLLEETEKDFKKKIDKFKGELDDIQEEFTKKSAELRQPLISEAAKAKIEKELMEVQGRGVALEQRYRNEALRSQQDLRDLEARLLKSVSADLRKKIAAFAETNGYDIVVDVTAAPYAKAEVDVTPGVLKVMGVDPAKAIEVSEDDAKKPANEGK